MIKSIKSFINIPIISIRDSKPIGKVKDFIVDPGLGKVVGILVSEKGFIFKKRVVLSFVDIREISPQSVIVDDKLSLVPQKEVLDLDLILRSKIKINKSKVMGTSGRYIGRVYDYAIDEFFNLVKLYVYPPTLNIFENQRIFSREQITQVLVGIIIVDDENKLENKELAEAI